MSMKEITKYLAIGLVGIVTLLVSCTSDAGEIMEHPTNPTVIAFVGPVEETDPQMLRDYLVEHQEVTKLALYSGGGQVSAGLEMMEIIHLRGLNTVIPDTWKCYSICSFMWLGGAERTVEGSGELGVHQPFAPHEVALEMGPEAYKTMTMKTVAYMMWMVGSLGLDVDPYWWMVMMGTAGDDMYILTEEEVALFTR